MSNPFFKFKQFTVYHDRSTMKVGTDGVLLGAWTPFTGKEKHVLDIGTGCGLVALMLAQRIHNAQITGIDIDIASVGQANANFQASPWPERLKAELVPVQELSCQTDLRYDLIVSNPPFFVNSLPNPRLERMQARHTCMLSHEDLLHAVVALLEPQGTFALVLPVNEGQQFVGLAQVAGLSLARRTYVLPLPESSPKRLLLCFTKQPVDSEETQLVIETAGRHVYSDEYKDLTKDFYL